MNINNHVKFQRLLGKVDNDFNISESDWIPRAAAWTIDALSQMNCLPSERKTRKLNVVNRIATFPCELNGTDVKVFDHNGCEISQLSTANKSCCTNIGSSGDVSEIGITDAANKTGVNTVQIATILPNGSGRNFVISGNNIELNFDTDYITVESWELATYYDDYFDCEVPYIYDNGLLLEALAWYILFKYLSRGSKHTVYSLTSPNPVLNPYTQWNTLRPKAANAVKIALSKDATGWRNFFYNSTFTPRG